MRRSALAAAAWGIWLVTLGAAPAAAAVPAGFTDSLVAAVGAPTALAFTPDGRLLITSQAGTLRIYQNGALLATPALTMPASQICTNSERGLLGVAVDPAFPCNNFIYLFYTFNKLNNACPTGASAPVNRVSRFTLPASNVINPASELVLIDNMPSPGGNHNAGDLHFGKDGNLYVSIGEGGIASAARDEHVLTGKVLRITPAGGIPADNPFQGAGTARCNVTGSTTPGNRCQETYSWGFRNPFRMGFDQNASSTRFYINDVGAGLWEEIDLGTAGADFGWNLCEGKQLNNSLTTACSPAPPLVNPLFDYQHNTQIPGTTSPASCNCISGGDFVPNGLWPGYDGAYLFGDCTCGGIFRLTQSGSVFSASDFGSGLGTVVHLLFGPHAGTQALYYTTYASGGQVRRVTLDNPPADPADFFSIPPCRLLDTRNAPGPSGGPSLQTCTTRTFPVAGAGACGVPATARAVAVNLTIVSPTGGGQIVIYPAGTLAPAAATTLQFNAGQIRSNNGVLGLATNGQIAVLPTISGGGTAHLTLDVVGYFE